MRFAPTIHCEPRLARLSASRQRQTLKRIRRQIDFVATKHPGIAGAWCALAILRQEQQKPCGSDFSPTASYELNATVGLKPDLQSLRDFATLVSSNGFSCSSSKQIRCFADKPASPVIEFFCLEFQDGPPRFW